MKLKPLYKNKKGDITDGLSLIIVALALGIGLFIFAFIIPQITTGLRNGGINNTVQAENTIDNLEDFGINGIQKGFFFVFVGLCISILVSSFFINTHPVWMFLYIFFLIIGIVMSVYIANIYEQFATNPLFASMYATQGYINVVFQNLVKIFIGITAISFVIIFSRFAFMGGIGGGRL